MTAPAGALALKTSYHLVATDEAQLRAAHADMIAWSIDRQDACDSERTELEENERVARANGWDYKPFQKRIAMFRRRHAFYQKIEHALRAGYVIVPNFTMDVFAIRTDAEAPKSNDVTSTGWISPGNFTQSAKLLELGDGRYVSPEPLLHEMTSEIPTTDGKGTRTQTTRWAEAFRVVNFPLALAKPALMQRTADAMESSVFDEIGVAQDARASKGDPIILGRILNPRRNAPAITFFIGWYFDPTNL